jgi:hypothetical protein
MKIFLSDLRHKDAYLQSIAMEEEKSPLALGNALGLSTAYRA